MTGLAAALCVIIVPVVLSLLLVRRMGVWPGVLILLGLLIWFAVAWNNARNPGNVAIAPEIFGVQTIAYSQRTGIADGLFAVFVLGPAIVWAGIALLIGRASFRKREVAA